MWPNSHSSFSPFSGVGSSRKVGWQNPKVGGGQNFFPYISIQFFEKVEGGQLPLLLPPFSYATAFYIIFNNYDLSVSLKNKIKFKIPLKYLLFSHDLTFPLNSTKILAFYCICTIFCAHISKSNLMGIDIYIFVTNNFI